jgi:hypothetical protein
MCCSPDDCHKMLVRLMPLPTFLGLPHCFRLPPSTASFLPDILLHPPISLRLGLGRNSTTLPLSTSKDDILQISQCTETNGDEAWLGRKRVKAALKSTFPNQNIQQMVRSAAKRHRSHIAGDQNLISYDKSWRRVQVDVCGRDLNRCMLSEHKQSKSVNRQNQVGRLRTQSTRRHVDGPKPPPAPKPEPKPEQPKPVPSV